MKFKVGDRVQFKSWEEMEKEFGLNNKGEIKTTICFSPLMEHLCGTFATIYSIYGNDVFLKDMTAKGRTFFAYTLDMLKPAKGEKKYRVGDKVQYNGSTYVCDGACSRKEDTDKYELHIMSDGKKTTAVYKKNGGIVSRSEANLHPDDEFNFKTGAQIAFDRVFQPEPEKKEHSALYINGTIFCGYAGDPTGLHDLCDRPLFVGDIVLLKDNAGERKIFINNKTQSSIENPLVRQEWGEYSILLVTPFSEVKPKTTISGITMLVK